MGHAIPGLTLFVGKRSITKRAPLLKQSCTAVLPAKIGRERFFEASAKGQSRPSLFLTPPIEIAIPVAAPATKVTCQLGIAIRHSAHPAENRHRILEFGGDSSGIVHKISNTKILESCLAQLQKLKSCIEANGLDENDDMVVLTRIYGTSRPGDGERTLIDAYLCWLGVVRSNKNVDEKSELPSSEDCKFVFFNVLDREIARLKRYKREQSMIESKRKKIELLCRSVPEGLRLERLLRYDASLERSVYRTLNQLERLQRIRKGQLVPPIFDVNVS